MNVSRDSGINIAKSLSVEEVQKIKDTSDKSYLIYETDAPEKIRFKTLYTITKVHTFEAVAAALANQFSECIYIKKDRVSANIILGDLVKFYTDAIKFDIDLNADPEIKAPLAIEGVKNE